MQVDIEKIIPVTEARDSFNKIIDEVEGTDHLYVLTKNGKPSAVIVGVNHLEKLTGDTHDTITAKVDESNTVDTTKVSKPFVTDNEPVPAPDTTPAPPAPPPAVTPDQTPASTPANTPATEDPFAMPTTTPDNKPAPATPPPATAPDTTPTETPSDEPTPPPAAQ